MSLGGHLPDRRVTLIALVVLAVASVGLLGTAVDVASAQETTSTATNTPVGGPVNNSSVDSNAPYYVGADDEVANGSWLPGDEATLENVLALASRFGTFVVGDRPAQGEGVGSAGPLLVGAILVGGMLGATVRSGVGSVGGGVLAIVSVVGLAAIDVAPSWLYAVGLFALGIVLAAVAKRAIR